MKKLAVLTAVLFLFGVAGFAMADEHQNNSDPAIQANNNDLTLAGGAAANDGSTATTNKTEDSGNTKTVTVTKNDASTNTKTETEDSFNTKTVDVNKTVDVVKTEDSFNKSTEESFNKSTDESFNTKVEAEKGSQAANNGGTNVKQEAFIIKNELPGSGDSIDARSTTTTTTDSHATGTGSTGNNSIGSGSAGAVYVGEDANYQGAGAQYKSNNNNAEEGAQQAVGGGSNTMVKSSAEEGGLSAINTTGAITLDKSTTISISNIGLSVQKTDLEGKVEDNKLIVGGPKAVSVTKGEAKTGEAETGKAESEGGFAISKSKSGSGAFAGASSGASDGLVPTFKEDDHRDSQADPSSTTSADADSKSKSKSNAAANSGAASSGAASSGDATGGQATSAAVTATTTFYTGANNLAGSINFNGLGGFNVNSGVNSLNQSSINVNAVVGGNALGK